MSFLFALTAAPSSLTAHSTFQHFSLNDIGIEAGQAIGRFVYVAVGSIAIGVGIALLYALVRGSDASAKSSYFCCHRSCCVMQSSPALL